MAQIEIERKKKHSIWPWIIAAIIILLLLWWWASSRNDNANTAVLTDSTMTTTSGGAIATGAAATGAYATGASTSVNGTGAAAAGTQPAVAEFSTWVAQTDANRDESGQHTYTAGGLRRLADALAAEGASGSALDSLRKQADALQSSSATSLHHADMARSAFVAASNVIASMAASHQGVAADTAKVRSAATAMKPGNKLLDQKDKVQSFFDAARDALQAMSQTS